MGKYTPEQIRIKAKAWSRKDNPFREFLSRIADKWSLLTLTVLLKIPGQRCRFSELKSYIPGISQRMLTVTLRNLAQDGLVSRHVYAEVPPRVEYELTALGKSLRTPIKSLFKWLRTNWPAAQRFRGKHKHFDTSKNTVKQS
jgi:DNA-binding HxlR family transcriptional regulator